MPRVFYNDECLICSLEINHYRNKCNSIEWMGIHKNSNIHKEINKTNKQIIRRLHLENNGEILVGVDAFIFIWSQIPSYKLLSKVIKFPGIYHFAIFFYEFLAFFLYVKNYKHVKKINSKLKK